MKRLLEYAETLTVEANGLAHTTAWCRRHSRCGLAFTGNQGTDEKTD